MPQRNTFPRLLLTVILLMVFCAGLFAPSSLSVEAKPLSLAASNIVISEFRTTGPSGGNDEFVELYNPTNVAIDITGWRINGSNNSGSTSTRLIIGSIIGTVILQPGQFYLATRSGVGNYTGLAIPDETYSTGITDTGGIALYLADNTTLIDAVGMDNGSAYLEGTVLSPLTSGLDRSYERKLGGTDGHCLDNNNNSTDFSLIVPSNPQNSSTFVTCTAPPIEILINEVAWMGTIASPNDEWIELYNPGISDVDLTGWRLVSNDGNPDIVFNSSTCIPSTCIIPSGTYFLLERAHDNVVQGVSANLIFLGQLGDTNETLTLTKPDATIVDTANSDGGAWPAGITSPASSMERVGTVADGNLAWSTFQGVGISIDAGGNLINGTPNNSNVMLNITPTFTPSITPSPTNTLTPTATLTPTRTITPTSSSTRAIVINEIAWAGTISSLSDDEWIELYNPGSTAINITGWRISASDGSPNIILTGSIPAGGYFLLEKDDDNTVLDILADQIYTGNSLENAGESLTLYDSANKSIDTANSNGGSWPAGSSSTYGTMERILNTTDSDSAWVTNNGTKKNGKNANNGDILGTPKQSNTAGPTPTPANSSRTSTPTLPPIDPRAIINEISARPGFDWNQDGKTDVFDEFIEIKNLTSIDITLNGWKVDKGIGSKSFSLPNVTLKPNERIVFYSLETNLLLSDGGETIRLINPSNKIYDAYTYNVAKAEDKSFCRLPDGNVYNGWYDDCLPTPNQSNTREGNVPTSPSDNESSVCNLPDTIPNDFFFAECKGYGNNIWNPFYWGDLFRTFIKSNTTKWETFFE